MELFDLVQNHLKKSANVPTACNPNKLIVLVTGLKTGTGKYNIKVTLRMTICFCWFPEDIKEYNRKENNTSSFSMCTSQNAINLLIKPKTAAYCRAVVLSHETHHSFVIEGKALHPLQSLSR
jgi:hypothetical protein